MTFLEASTETIARLAESRAGRGIPPGVLDSLRQAVSADELAARLGALYPEYDTLDLT